MAAHRPGWRTVQTLPSPIQPCSYSLQGWMGCRTSETACCSLAVVGRLGVRANLESAVPVHVGLRFRDASQKDPLVPD